MAYVLWDAKRWDDRLCIESLKDSKNHEIRCFFVKTNNLIPNAGTLSRLDTFFQLQMVLGVER